VTEHVAHAFEVRLGKPVVGKPVGERLADGRSAVSDCEQAAGSGGSTGPVALVGGGLLLSGLALLGVRVFLARRT
jgi:hypothetical protein